MKKTIEADLEMVKMLDEVCPNFLKKMDYMLVLKCDNIGCGYISPKDKFEKFKVGQKCPDCGSDMLTQKDYNDLKKLIEDV